ncbi:MAG: hypothetical protein Q4F39_07245 [Bacteroidia bacterium]|nr:hypothetical protein [Bacteroidia bacterium]
MKESKTTIPPERSPYVPASLKVIEITPQCILCGSGNDSSQFPPTEMPEFIGF